MARSSCICRPSMKCSLHRKGFPRLVAPPQEGVRFDNGLMRPKLSRGNLCRKAGFFTPSTNINSGEVERTAVGLSRISRAPQKIRLKEFRDKAVQAQQSVQKFWVVPCFVPSSCQVSLGL